MIDLTCNGYTNWETSTVIINLSHNAFINAGLPEEITAETIKNYVDIYIFFFDDKLTEKQLKSVNWEEVSDAMIEE